ncbi:MAG: c-type cytochrome [Terriglobales bacterium]
MKTKLADHRRRPAGWALHMFSSFRSRGVLALVLLALWIASVPVVRSQTRSQTPTQTPRRQDLKTASTRGKQTFASTCAGCHGLDGKGGERAPNIADNPKVQKLSDAQIFGIIQKGIPGTGMPAFHSLEDSAIKAVVSYLHTLQGTDRGAKQPVKLPGDPERGETIFFGKAGCSGCHMVGGKGGFIASDLSAYARTHDVEQTRSAIANPVPGSDRQARMATVTMRGGEKYAGRIRNEDNFSVQLQTLDGTFHFVSKPDWEAIEYSSQPLMPSDYGLTLTSGELNDVVSYLMSVASAGRSGRPTKADEEE